MWIPYLNSCAMHYILKITEKFSFLLHTYFTNSVDDFYNEVYLEMINYTTDEQKRKNLIQFVKVTQALLETDGLKNISIRKIATQAGFHNSTIYLYFEDLDELIMLASIKQFQDYSIALESQSLKDADAYDNFYAIWSYFADAAFQHSCIFHNFFFGKHSDNLHMFLNVYYDLFPEEQNKYSDDIKAMYFGNNYSERCLKILLPLIGDSRTRVTKENVEIINDISVCFCKEALHQKCEHPELDNEKLKEKMLKMLHYTVDQ